MDRKSIFEAANTICGCGEREREYGSPADNFEVIGELWNVYTNRACLRNGKVFFTPHDVAVMMSLMKHGRIATGQIKDDNYIDACGYLACAAEIATE